MKRINILTLSLAVSIASNVFAGNPDRVGQAGGNQLLMNPWSRSSGWNMSNIATVKGVEAMQFNAAGILSAYNTEVAFSRSSWFGNQVSVNALGFTQSVGKDSSGAIGLTIQSFDFGDITRTTVDLPDGIGTYGVQMLNLGFGYTKNFSDRINGGFLIRGISEGISNAKAQGICLDAGIQYQAGDFNEIKFGVALKNIGPKLTTKGDGLSLRASPDGTDLEQTLQQRSADFELPSILLIGASYDYLMGKNNRLTFAGTFVSNAFDKDQGAFGLEYSLNNKFMFRGGYALSSGQFTKDVSQTFSYSGPSAGATFGVPFGKDGSHVFNLDYSYRPTYFIGGTHTFGARISL